jgi:small basic protein (TIGR04137 family)
MSIDKSLKKKGSLARSRNVLKRHERIAQLKDEERWTEANGPFNLPKTRVARTVVKKGGPKKTEEKADAAPAKGAKGGKK